MRLVEVLTVAALAALAVNLVGAMLMIWKRQQIRASLERDRLERLTHELRGAQLRALRQAVDKASKAEKQEQRDRLTTAHAAR